jgi:hypothetical protein
METSAPHNFEALVAKAVDEGLKTAVEYSGQRNEKNEPDGYGERTLDTDLLNPFGIIRGLSGKSTYKGQFKDGKFDGYGIKIGNGRGIRAGQWSNDVLTGWGIDDWGNGIIAEGQFVANKLNGVGRYNLDKTVTPSTDNDPTIWHKWEDGVDTKVEATPDEIANAKKNLEETATKLDETLEIISKLPNLERKIPPLSGVGDEPVGGEAVRRLGGRKRSSKKRNGKKKRKSSKK